MDNLAEKYKLKLKDMELEVAQKKFDICQPKYDGWWVVLVFKDNKCQVVTAGGEVRHEFPVKCGHLETRLIAEWMYGTTWGVAYKEKTGCEFIVHDRLMKDGKDIRDRKYIERLQSAATFLNSYGVDFSNFKMAETYLTDFVHVVWRNWVDNLGFEGLVFKNRNSVYGDLVGRCKDQFTADYVFMGINPGDGKYLGVAGSLKGGLYVNGVLTEICSVGGLTDFDRSWFKNNENVVMGSVFQAHGKKKFATGALRHPGYDRLRPDKKPEECVLEVK